MLMRMSKVWSAAITGGNSFWTKTCIILCILMGPIGLLAASLKSPKQPNPRRWDYGAGSVPAQA